MRRLFSKIATLSVGLAMAIGVGVAASRQSARNVNAVDTETKVLDATTLNLTSTALTSDTEKTYGGVTYVLPTGSKQQALGSSPTNKYSNNPTIIVTHGQSIHNKTALPGPITKFEIYLNAGASTATTALMTYGDEELTSDAETPASTALDTANKSYNLTGTGAGHRFFRYTNDGGSKSKGSQIQIRITYALRYVTSVAVSGTLTKTSYYDEQEFDPTGLVFTANWTDGDVVLDETERAKIEWSTLHTGDTSVTGTYENVEFTVNGITVSEDEVDGVAVTGSLTKTAYNVGQSWDRSGLIATAHYVGKGNVVVTNDAVWSFSPETANSAEITSVRVTAAFGGQSGYKDCAVTVSVPSGPVLVKPGDHLNLGDQVFFAESTGHAAGSLSGSYLRIVSVIISNEVITNTGNALSFKLGVNYDDKYTFEYDDALLGADANKSLTFDSSADNGWDIDVSAEKATVSNDFGTLIINLNSGSERFLNYLTYTEGPKMVVPQLYRVVATDSEAAAEFRNNYLHMSDYTTSQGYCLDTDEHHYYANAKAAYPHLTTAQKSLLTSDDLARLSAWAQANGETFDPVKGTFTKLTVENYISSSSANYAIIIIVATVSITALGLTLMIVKKKKHD